MTTMVGVTNTGVGERIGVGMGGCVDGKRVDKNCSSEIPGGISTTCVSTASVPATVRLGSTTLDGRIAGVETKPLQDDKAPIARNIRITVLPMILTLPLPLKLLDA